jgi:hypothetical protein
MTPEERAAAILAEVWDCFSRELDEPDPETFLASEYVRDRVAIILRGTEADVAEGNPVWSPV